ncbi:MAG: hypothetical protein P1U40_07390 [Coxiellaceae bacterium]|nr:hypothetical protein [Coxiellaceae bacterium]
MKVNIAPVRNNLVMSTVASMLFISAYVASMFSSALSTKEKESPLLAVYGITAVGTAVVFLTLTLAALHGFLKKHTVYDSYGEFKQKYKEKAPLKIGDCIDQYLIANPDVERVMCNMSLPDLPEISHTDEEYVKFTKLLTANKILRKRAYIQWGLSAFMGAIIGVAAASQVPHAFTDEHGATTLRKIGIGAMITAAVFDVALTAMWCWKQRHQPKSSLNNPLTDTANYGSVLGAAPLQESPRFK